MGTSCKPAQQWQGNGSGSNANQLNVASNLFVDVEGNIYMPIFKS
jgi:hypothetical protein